MNELKEWDTQIDSWPRYVCIVREYHVTNVVT